MRLWTDVRIFWAGNGFYAAINLQRQMFACLQLL
jgi:hypothetical protein